MAMARRTVRALTLSAPNSDNIRTRRNSNRTSTHPENETVLRTGERMTLHPFQGGVEGRKNCHSATYSREKTYSIAGSNENPAGCS